MTVQPDFSRTWGIDVSHWNGLTDMQTAKAKGCKFVIIKACDGSVPTRWYKENRERAKAAGLPWGAYVWLYPGNRVPIGTQVAAWWALVKDDYPPLGVWIDFEWTKYAGVPANPVTGDLVSALDKFTATAGKKPGIYTSKGYTDQYAPGFRGWDAYKLWVAHYGVTIPALPAGATKWTFHQWTSAMDGSLAPSENLGLDGDYYGGTQSEFEAEFGLGGTEMLYGKVTATPSLNIRNGAGAACQDIGDLLYGDLVTASEEVNGWWHLTDATRAGVPVKLASGLTVKEQAAKVGNVYASAGGGLYITPVEPPAEAVTLKSWQVVVIIDGVEHTFSGN